MESKQICLWSGPRNISTALMYSFAQRTDTQVVDEPLYAHYLTKSATAAYHPGAAQVIQSQENDGEKVINYMFLNHESPNYFYKHMAHHLLELDLTFLSKTTNIILTREPQEMINSFAKVIAMPSLHDLGYQQQVDLIQTLIEMDERPILIDSSKLLQNPKVGLEKLCLAIDIPFQESMLNWEVGPRKEDGVWAKHWYKSVHISSGFMAKKVRSESFPERLLPLLLESEKLYEQIRSYSLLI